jgi:hypothetical protein
MKDNFIVVRWPAIRELMNKEGFKDNAELIEDERYYQLYGDSVYFVNKEWYNKVMNHGK